MLFTRIVLLGFAIFFFYDALAQPIPERDCTLFRPDSENLNKLQTQDLGKATPKPACVKLCLKKAEEWGLNSPEKLSSLRCVWGDAGGGEVLSLISELRGPAPLPQSLD